MNFKAVFIILSLSIIMGFSSRPTDLYQLITSHPHDLVELKGYITTVHKAGRLQVVKVNKDIPAGLLKYLRPLTGEEKSYLYLRPDFLSGSATISRYSKKVSAANIRKDVEILSSFKTRLVGTEDNKKAVALIGEKLSLMGYEVKENCYRAGACSLLADKIGSHFKEEVVLVIAHMDSVGADFAGADDNASGTAALLEMARVLKSFNNRRTIRFFVTNGEESGLLGAKHYASELKRSGDIKQIVLAVNMDMVGYNSNGIVEIETSTKLKSLAKWFATLAAQYTKLQSKITLGAWGSDHVPFIEAGVPTVLTIENWDTKTPCYHRSCDKPDTLNYEYAAEIARLNVAAVMTKDQE